MWGNKEAEKVSMKGRWGRQRTSHKRDRNGIMVNEKFITPSSMVATMMME